MEDSAVGLMELVSFEGWFFQINSPRTDFIECEMPHFSGRRRGPKEMRTTAEDDGVLPFVNVTLLKVTNFGRSQCLSYHSQSARHCSC